MEVETSTPLADGVVLTSAWVLAVLAGAGTVIAFLFKSLIASKDREIERIKEDFALFVEQTRKDELRREKEDAHVKLLIDEAIRIKKKADHDTDHLTRES